MKREGGRETGKVEVTERSAIEREGDGSFSAVWPPMTAIIDFCASQSRDELGVRVGV